MLLEETFELDTKPKAEWEAVSSTLGITERLVTIIDWGWKFTSLTFSGKGSKHLPYQLFDEIICGFLLKEEGLSGDRIRELLGLADELGRKAFAKMVFPLIHDRVVEGDESYYALSEKGLLHAQQGNKFKQFEKGFSIVLDLQDLKDLQGHETLKLNPNHILVDEDMSVDGDPILALGLIDNLEKQRQVALIQAREVHLPEKGFYLDEAILSKRNTIAMPIRVAIIEDFAQSSHRFRALHPTSGKHLAEISAKLNRTGFEELCQNILANAEEELVAEISQEDKSEMQTEDEAWAILQAKEASHKSAEDAKTESEKAILSKRKSFDGPAFEREMSELVETCKGEVWMISPWVRPRAFRARKQQIQQLLKRGCFVFVGYSAPYNQEEMLTQEVRRELENLSNSHEKFFHAELPQFHEKILYVRNPPAFEYEYTGSFNILSLYAKHLTKIGRENMRRLPWGKDSQKNYEYVRAIFERAYLEVYLRKGEELTLDPKSKDFLQQFKAVEKRLDQVEQKVNLLVRGERKLELEEAVLEMGMKMEAYQQSWVAYQFSSLESRLASKPELSIGERQKLENELKEIEEHWPAPSPHPQYGPLRKSILEKNGRWSFTQYLKELGRVEKEMTQKEKENWTKKLESMIRSFEAIEEVFTPLIAECRDLIRGKSQIKGLKEIGRIDLPPRKNKKRKKK